MCYRHVVQRRKVWDKSIFGNWLRQLEVPSDNITPEKQVNHFIINDLPTDNTGLVKWKKEDGICFSLIVQCIAEGNTSKAIWEKLAATFELKGVTSRLLVLKRILTLKYIDGESMETHLCKFDDMVRQVKSTASKLEDDLLACLLFLSHPESYNTIVTAIKTLSGEKITVDFVKNRLLSEDLKRHEQSGNEVNISQVSQFDALNRKLVNGELSIDSDDYKVIYFIKRTFTYKL